MDPSVTTGTIALLAVPPLAIAAVNPEAAKTVAIVEAGALLGSIVGNLSVGLFPPSFQSETSDILGSILGGVLGGVAAYRLQKNSSL